MRFAFSMKRGDEISGAQQLRQLLIQSRGRCRQLSDASSLVHPLSRVCWFLFQIRSSFPSSPYILIGRVSFEDDQCTNDQDQGRGSRTKDEDREPRTRTENQGPGPRAKDQDREPRTEGPRLLWHQVPLCMLCIVSSLIWLFLGT